MRSTVALPVLLALGSAALVAAQDPAESFADRVDVEVVNVDVTVVDRDGSPVRNLVGDDFRLSVDGKKVAVQYFDPPEADSGPQESVVLLIDNRHLAPGLRNEALETIEEPLLKLAQSGVQIKVATFGGVLQVLQPFTTDATQIRTALARATRAGNEASKRMWEARQVAVSYVINNLRSLPRTPPPELIEQTSKAVMSQLQGFAEYEHEDGMELVDSLRLMVAALGGVSGHKTVLLMSDGFALQPVDKVFDRLARSGKKLSQTDPTEVRAPEDARFSQRSSFAQSVVPGGASEWRRGYETLKIVDDLVLLGRVANTGGVTVHTLPLTPTFVDEVERGMQVDLGQDRFVVSDLDFSLRMIADETGGRAHDRADDLAAFLARAVAEIPSSYSLGFTPKAPDAEYHEIKVKVKGKGLRVRHRPGYVARSFGQRFAARTIAAVSLDLVENPHQLGIEIQEMKSVGDGVHEVSIVVNFSIGKLSLTSDGTNYFADLWVSATYLDPEGQVGDFSQVQTPLVIPEAELDGALEQKFGAVLLLRMPAGSQPTGVGLWNRTSGRSSFIAGNIDVQPAPEEGS